MEVDYKNLIKKVLSEYPGLTASQIEEKILKIIKTPLIEKFDLIEMYSFLNEMENEGILRKEKNKYFLNI